MYLFSKIEIKVAVLIDSYMQVFYCALENVSVYSLHILQRGTDVVRLDQRFILHAKTARSEQTCTNTSKSLKGNTARHSFFAGNDIIPTFAANITNDTLTL